MVDLLCKTNFDMLCDYVTTRVPDPAPVVRKRMEKTSNHIYDELQKPNLGYSQGNRS